MSEEIKEKILRLVEEYYAQTQTILPQNKAPITGKIYDSEELKNLVEAALEGWWTEGKWNKIFEDKLKKFLGIKYVLTVNSGSSANLIALTALTSSKLANKRINKGDEIITVAAGFPTTINPILQIGAIPVFLDVNISTYDFRVEDLEKALSVKTKAVMIAHTLGNPYDAQAVKEFCKTHNLWFIEDNCDALGSTINGELTGTFGDFSTSSFYPAHHITTAEGGAVFTNNAVLYSIAKSLRDWGRNCWCGTGQDNTCKKRFSWKLGDLPYGYDHKYIYSEIGYNLKMTDFQASIGAAQMEKLPGFIKKRKENFQYLLFGLKKFEKEFILPVPNKNTDPSWFGFLITVKEGEISRDDLTKYLNKNNIATRLLFGGNITKQPYFVDNKILYRQTGELNNTNTIMNNSFWIGVYPGLGKKHLDYVISKFEEYVSNIKNESSKK